MTQCGILRAWLGRGHGGNGRYGSGCLSAALMTFRISENRARRTTTKLKDRPRIGLICASQLIVKCFEVVSVLASPAGHGDGHDSVWLKDFIGWLDCWYPKPEIPPDYEKWLRSTLQSDSEISLWNLSFDVSARVGWRPVEQASNQAKAEPLFQA